MQSNEESCAISTTRINKREADGIKHKMVLAARKECQANFVQFADCSKETTWRVAWACRPQLKELNDCLKLYTTDAHFEVQKLKYIQERETKRQQERETKGQEERVEQPHS